MTVREDDDPEASDTGNWEQVTQLPDLPDPELTVGPDLLEPVSGRPFDPAPRREMVRTALALSLVAILAVMSLAPLFAILFAEQDFERLRDYYATVFPTMSGLVGGAVGFYFGSSRPK
jgi:hypothetical protein